MFIQDFFNELNRRQINYVLVGGLAVNLHGIPRSTFDIDLALALDNQTLEQFWNVTKYFDMSPRQPITLDQLQNAETRQSWIEDKHFIAVTFGQNQPPHMEVDVLLNTHHLSFDYISSHAVLIQEKGLRLKVADIETLIKLKRLSNREQDIQDIKLLEQLL